MRMWMVDPRHMCDKHLLGEHVELHMFVGAMNKGTSMKGFLDNNLLEPGSLYARHELLVGEMLARGMRHQSPLGALHVAHASHYLRPAEFAVKIDREAAGRELFRRCEACRARHP